MKIFHTYIIILFSLSLQSCVSMLFNPETTTSSDYIHIHKNPKPGDYVIRSIDIAGNPKFVKWEVQTVDDEGILVKRSFPDDEELTLWNQFLLDATGNVKEAWLYYDGKRYAQQIISPPEPGSLENFTKVERLPSRPYSTQAGKFTVDEVNTFTLRSDLGIAMVDSVMVDYVSYEVPFHILERRSEFGFEPGPFMAALSTITYTADALINSKYQKLFDLDKSTGKAEGVQYERLIKYGYGK